MPDFKMSEIEHPEENPLRGFDDDYANEPLPRRETTQDAYGSHDDYAPPRKGSWFIGLVLFILIAAVAAAGYYGYSDLKQTQELNNVYGSGEFEKLDAKVEAMLTENNIKLNQEMQALAQKQAELATLLAQSQKKADGYVKDLAKSNGALNDLQKELAALTAKHDDTVKKLEAAQTKLALLDKLNKDLANAEARVNDLESTVVTAANSLAALSQSTTKLSTQIETLANQQTALSKNVAEVVKNQAASGQNVSTTVAQLKKLQADIDKANVEILKIKNLADASMVKELNAIKNDLGELKRKVELLQ